MDTGPTDDDGEAADGLVSYSPQLGEARRFGGPRVAPLVRAMNEVLAVDPTRGEDLWTALLAALESEDEVIAGQGDGASLWKASEACTFSSEAVVLSWLLLSQCEGFYRGVFPYTRQPRGPPDGLEQGNASPSPARLFLPVVGLINRIVKALAEAGEEEEGHDESRIPRKVADALLEGSPSEGYRTLLPALVGLLVIITEDRGSVVALRKCEFSKIHARRLSEGGMISLAPFEGGSLLDVLVVASLRFMPYMPDASMALAASICNVCPYLYSIPAFTAEKLEEALRKSIKAAANGRPRGEEIAGLLSEGVAALLLWNYRECTPLVLAMLSHSEAYDASLGLEGRALLEGPLGVIRTVVEVSEEAVGEGLEEDDISHDDILDVVPETLVGLLPITQAIVLRQHSSRVKANEVITFLALCLGEDEEEPLRDIVLWLQHSPELETTERGYNISYGTDVAALMEHVAVEGAKADLDRLNEEVKGLSKRLTWEEERLLAVREEKGRAVALEDYHRAGELKGEEERLLLSIGHLKSLGLPEHT
ncbi:hypothetical protein Pmar_PMAR012188 [Perkinsus marinus ATCC 50983]|uniref:Uncharacterized protein n=1 Tax=Perkinsus marinus (strain ATCC 50983 / TXsc) TaxID=423536 RepID=C5K866_PERM5|nr:hypothetical protein Pmar_PMAR012188 [Perkinsus marinus ATCC 50983]EER19336.1 hypothetical protein Pmar_PMAR012188 [Perkinsus marinus ATCC 50983]|eukprot:XP_002787540.1 hypothetical protein Pmar_PMAR012188 [Perkinsus marinus ATCC 50983]